MIENSKKTSPSVDGTPLRLCSIDFSQGDFNTKDRNRQYTVRRRQQYTNENDQQNKDKGKQRSRPKTPYNVNPKDFLDEKEPVTLRKGDVEVKTTVRTGLGKQAEDTVKSNLEAQKYESDLRGAKARHEAAPILRSEKRAKAREDLWKSAKDKVEKFGKDPGGTVEGAVSKVKTFIAGDGQKKGLADALKETKGSLDTTVSRMVYGKDLDPTKRKGDAKKLEKITGESVGKKGVKEAYKEVGKEISSNLTVARDIGTGIKDAINPNAKYKRIAKYGKGADVSRLGRAISRGDTKLGEGKLAKAVGWTLQKGGSKAMERKAVKNYEKKDILKSMRGFSEEEMLAYDEIFKALIEEDFTTVKPGDQSEKPISEETLKELIDTNFYEANDSEEKKYHESVVKGYSFNESTGRYESLSREIFGEA